MFWNKLLQAFSLSYLIMPPLPQPRLNTAYMPTSMQELLSYECAKSVATLLAPQDQSGPVFAVANLVFTSIEANDNSRILIVSAGGGTYSLPLERTGLNRLRFMIPTHDSTKPTEYFLGFLHDSVTRSRFFDFSVNRPPMGKEETDYGYVVPRRAESLLPHMEYGIHETAQNMLASLAEGRINRSQMARQKADNCEHLIRTTPLLGQNLKHSLEVVGKIVIGSDRAPARISADIATANPKP